MVGCQYLDEPGRETVKTHAKALVVDDSMLIRHTVCRFLEERGFTVEAATNGQEAIELLAGFHPDVIVTDMQMPKMSGGELIAAVKGVPDLAGIPVIVLAAKGALGAELPGAAALVIKDIDIEAQLERALAALIPSS